MTTAEDILKKHKTRKRKNFEPIIRRAWDDIASIDRSEKTTPPNEDKKSENEHKSNIGTNIGTESSIKKQVQIDSKSTEEEEKNNKNTEKNDRVSKRNYGRNYSIYKKYI